MKVNPGGFAFRLYTLTAKDESMRIVSTKRVYSPKCYLPEGYDTNDVTCLFGRFEIPNDHDSVTFEARPLNAWGAAGEAIESEPGAYDKAKVLYPF